jgi:hypothetical protein
MFYQKRRKTQMKAKKFLAGACATFMMAMSTATAVSAAESVKVTVGNAKAEAGGKFSVTVDLADIPAAGINGCDFGVKFDSSVLTITNVKAGALAKSDTASLEGVNALETNIESGLVSIIYGLGTTESSNYMTGSGTFVTLEGTVSNTAAAGKYDLKLVAVDRLADPDGSAENSEIIFGNLAADNTTYTVYTPTIVNGYVEVTSSSTSSEDTKPIGTATKLGDVDCNTEVAIGDVIALGKYLVNKSLYPLSDEGVANANVVSDSSIDSLDSSKLLEFITGQIKKL